MNVTSYIYIFKAFNTGLDKQKIAAKIVNISLLINFTKCFGCSKEPSYCDGSFEYPKHMFWLRNKKIKISLHTLNLGPAFIESLDFCNPS